jgi:hypothetical protein
MGGWTSGLNPVVILIVLMLLRESSANSSAIITVRPKRPAQAADEISEKQKTQKNIFLIFVSPEE